MSRYGRRSLRRQIPALKNSRFRSMSSIKRDVKEKAPPRPEARRFCLEIQPTAVSVPPDSPERFCSGLSAIAAGFMCRW